MFFKNSVVRFFAVFCGVLRCFVYVFLAFFTKQHKTDQQVYNIQNAQNEQNTLCAIQRNTVLCIFLSLKKCLKKTFAKHVQNILQNIRKTPQNTVFQNTLAKHHKTPAKHPQ